MTAWLNAQRELEDLRAQLQAERERVAVMASGLSHASWKGLTVAQVVEAVDGVIGRASDDDLEHDVALYRRHAG